MTALHCIHRRYLNKNLLHVWVYLISQDLNEGGQAKEAFGGRVTYDFIAERLGLTDFSDVRELDFPQSNIRTVDLGKGQQFTALRR